MIRIGNVETLQTARLTKFICIAIADADVDAAKALLRHAIS
ncbi:hypothetical protein [Scytonema sp. NUACC21]